MVVQRKIMLKYQKQIKKWEEVKHKKDLLELKKMISINGFFHCWSMWFKKKGTEDGLLPTTKRDLIKLLIEKMWKWIWKWLDFCQRLF